MTQTNSNVFIGLVSEGICVCDSMIISPSEACVQWTASQPGRTGGAEEDKIKEQDLESSSILSAPLFLPFFLFFLFEAGAVYESLCPSTVPQAYLTWLFSLSVLPSHPLPTPSLPTLSTLPLFCYNLLLFQHCTPSGFHRVWEGAWNGFPSATESGRICDQRPSFFRVTPM